MPFGSVFDYEYFAIGIIRRSRFGLNAHSQAYIEAVKETVASHLAEMPRGTTLYRAQPDVNREYSGMKESITPLPAGRMKPLPNSAREGRANPKGIPYLYLADKAKTAMSEVRPWRGAYISIGEFKTTADLKIVDCSKSEGVTFKGAGSVTVSLTDPKLSEAMNWNRISRAFAEPITDSDQKAQYAPTQMLAEVFKSLDFDGVKYLSLLDDDDCGFSYALFDLGHAELAECKVCQVKSITHEFSDLFERA